MEEEQRRKLVSETFGADGLFDEETSAALQANVRDSFRSLAVPQMEGLFGGRAEEVWSAAGVRHPRYAGFRNPSARLSFVASVCQVLLRIPSVAVFLDAHVGVCQRKAAGDCVTCLFHATREQTRGKDAGILLSLRGAMGAEFCKDTEQDAAKFLECLLHCMAVYNCMFQDPVNS